MGSYSSNYLRLLSYTKLLASHVNHARHDQALRLFLQIHSSVPLVTYDPFVFPLALKSCAATRRLFLGAAIHAYTLKISLLSNPFVACALVDMYGKCEPSIHSACQLFGEIPERNVMVWNAIISLYVHSNNLGEALRVFEMMDVMPNASTFNSIIAGLSGMDDGPIKAIAFYRRMQKLDLKPNLITLLALLPSCVGIVALNLVKEVHGYAIRNNVESHPHLRSALVEAYGRCGSLDNARYVFDGMHKRDVVAWSSLISAYALHGEARAALEIFTQMELQRVEPDGITFLGVLKACSHAGLADEARMYFAQMQKEYDVEATSDHYSCLVDVLSRAGRLHEAYEVIQQMPVKVTAKAWGALLGACLTYGEVELGEVAGRALFEIEPLNAAHYVLLAKIYASAGRHEEAQKMRREMDERGVKVAPGSSWFICQN
ncbi:hypothetical protein NMG60_11008293 [Bertholletia excelsa]